MQHKLNPLLAEWNTPFNIAPFSLITPGHYRPAIEHAIEAARREIDEITNSADEPGFANTIEALEKAGELLNRITPALFNLNSADTTPELQAVIQEISPLLTNFSNDITLNTTLFGKVKAVYEKQRSAGTEH